MANEKKIFVGGLDRDSDLRFVKNGDYRDALNVNVFSTEEDGEVGVVSNMKGAEEILRYTGVNYFGSEHEVIGAIEDPSFDRIIFFVAYIGVGETSSSEEDCIVEYNLKTNECYTLVRGNDLNFNSKYRINDAHIIGHKEDFSPEGILYFTDNYNPPRRINISEEKLNSANGTLAEIVPSSGGKKKYRELNTGFEFDGVNPTLMGFSGLGLSLDERINAARITPLVKPGVTLSTDESIKSNYIKGKAFKFKYRYQYRDKQFSAWSPVSEMVATENLTPQMNGTIDNLSSDNLVKVSFVIPNSDIESIEVAVRDLTNSDTYGLSDTLSFNNQNGFYYDGNKVGNNFMVGGYQNSELNNDSNNTVPVGGLVEYYFYNNEIYPAIDLRESTKLFNNIPIKSKTQSLLDGGRLAYGNVVTGRNGHDAKLNVRRYDAGDLVTDSQTAPVEATATCEVGYAKFTGGTTTGNWFCTERRLFNAMYTVKIKFNQLPEDAGSTSYNVVINNLPFTYNMVEDTDNEISNNLIGYFNLFSNAGNPPGTPGDFQATTLAQTFYNSVVSNITTGQIGPGVKIDDTKFTGNPMLSIVNQDQAYLRAGHVDIDSVENHCDSTSSASNCNGDCNETELSGLWADFTEGSFIELSGDEIIFRWSVINNGYDQDKFKAAFRRHHCYAGINQLERFVHSSFVGSTNVATNVVAANIISNINTPDGNLDVSNNSFSGYSINSASSEYDWLDRIESLGADIWNYESTLDAYNAVATSNATLNVAYTQTLYTPVAKGFKTGAWHNFGIVYYDKQGRSSSVQSKTSLYIPSHLETNTTTTIERSGVEWNIANKQAPSWADTYQVVYTGNRNIQKFEQFVTLGFSSSTLFPDLIFVETDALKKSVEACGGKGVNSEFSPGDRVRILNTGDASTNAIIDNSNFDFQIADIVKVKRYVPTQNDDSVSDITSDAAYDTIEISGQFLNVTRTLHSDSGISVPTKGEIKEYLVLNKSDFNTSDVYKSSNSLAINANAKILTNAVLEIYSPKKELDDDELIFFEFDKSHNTITESIPLLYCNFVEGSTTVTIDTQQYPNGIAASYIAEGTSLTNSIALPYGAVIEYINTQIVGDTPQVTSFVISIPSSSTINSLGALETTFKNTAHGTGYSTDSVDANGVSYANDSSDNTEDWVKLLSSNDQPNGDVYTRIRRNRVGGSIVVAGIESYHFSDYFKSDFWNSGRANKELESYHESRKPNTIIYTDSIIGNTYVNGLNSSFENEYFAEFDKSNGTIQKIFTKNNYIIIFQQDKILKAFVERNMNFTASGAGNLALSSEIISKSVPYAWEGGIGNHPESFANYGDVIYFFDSQRGEALKIQSDQVSLISDKGMSSYFTNKSKQLASMGSNAHIIGGYDVSKAEYVISFEGEFIEEDVELCDLAAEEYWSATETYNAGTVVSYALSTSEQATSGVAEINYIAFVQNTNTSPYNNSSVVTSATVTSSNALWSIGDTIAIPSASNTSSTSEGVITVNSVTRPIGTVTINNAGTGYEVNDIINLTGGQNTDNPGTVKVLSIGTDGAVTSISIVEGGDYTGYNIPLTAVNGYLESGFGFGLAVDIEYLSTGQILDYSLTDQGEYSQASSNYTPSIEDGDKTVNLSVVSQGAWTLCSGLGAQIGCTDSIANNYSSVAIFDDGSCNYNCLGVVFDEDCGSISAVSTPSTVNLDEILSSNLVDQASGIITYSITNSCEGNTSGNAYYTIIIRDGQVILFDTNHGNTVEYSGLLAGFYNFLTIDTNSILGNINSFTLPTGFTDPLSTELPDDTLLSNTQVLYNIIQDCGVGTEVTVQLLGCDNSDAVNNVQGYGDGIVINPTSIGEPDPCTFDIPGCTNSVAANYEPIATLDDGSCVVCEQDDVNNLFGVFAPNVTGLDSTTFNIEISLTDEAEGNEAWNPQYVITVFKGSVFGEIVFQESYLDINTYTEVGTGGTVYVNDLDLIDGSQLQEYVVRVEAVDTCTVDQIVVPGWDGCQTEGSLNYNSFATDAADCIDCTYVNSQVNIDSLTVGGQPTGLEVAGDVNNDNSVTVSINPGNLESLNSGVSINYKIELYDNLTLLQEYTIVGYNSGAYEHTFNNVSFQGLGSTEYTVYLTITSTYNDNTLTCYDQDSVTQQLYGCNSSTLDFNGVSLSTENYNNLATADDGTCYTCEGLTISNESVSPETNGDSTGVYTFKVEDVYNFVDPVNIEINGGETYLQVANENTVAFTSNPFNYTTEINNGQISISGLSSDSFTIILSYDSSSIAYSCPVVSSSFTITNEIPGCQDTTAQNFNNSEYGTVNADSTTFPDSCQFCLPSCSWSQETIVGNLNLTNDPLVPTNIQGGLFNVITNNTDVPGSIDGSIEFQLIRGSFTGTGLGGYSSWIGADDEIQAFIDLMEAGGQIRFTLYSDEDYINSVAVQSLAAADFIALAPQYAISNEAPLTVATFSNLDGYGDDGVPTEYFYEIEYLVVPQDEPTSTSSFFAVGGGNGGNTPFALSCTEGGSQVQYKFLEGCKYQYSTAIQDSTCPSSKDVLGGQSNASIFSNPNISFTNATINSLFLLNHANSVNNPTLESGSLTLQGSGGFNPNFWADSQNNGGSIAYVEYKLYPEEDTYNYFGGTAQHLHTLRIGYNDNGTVNIVTNSPSALAQNNGSGYFNGNIISANVSDLEGGDYNFTYSGLPPSTYRIRIRKVFSPVSESVCQTMINNIEVKVHGCNDSTATNSYTGINNSGINSSVVNSNVNNNCGAVCCMPAIVDCNDNTATNTVSPPSGYGSADTVVLGDIIQEFNFPSGSSSYAYNFPVTGDDSCYIAGCMNPNANNYNSNATAPCDESGVYDINNSADNSCCTGCIDPTALNYDSQIGSDYSGVVGGTDYSGCQYLYEADGETLFNNDSIQLDRVVGCDYIYQSTGNKYLVDSQITLSNFPIIINGAGEVIEENNLISIYATTGGNNNVIYSNTDINTSEVSFNYTSSSNGLYYGGNVDDFLIVYVYSNYGNYNIYSPSINSNITEAVQLLDAELVTPSTAEIQNAQGQACSIEYPTETFSGNTWFLKSAAGSSANNGASMNQRLYEDAGFNPEDGDEGVIQYIDFECLNVFADTGCPVKDLGYEVISQSIPASQVGIVFDQGNVKGSIIAYRQEDINIRLFLVDDDGNEIIHNQGDVLHTGLNGDTTLSTNLSPFSWNIKYETTSSNETTGEFTASLQFLQNDIIGKKIDINASSQNRVLATAWCPPTLDGLGLSAVADYGFWGSPAVGASQSNWLGLWCDQSTTEVNGVTITDVNNA